MMNSFPTSRIPAVNVAAVPQRSPLDTPAGKRGLFLISGSGWAKLKRGC